MQAIYEINRYRHQKCVWLKLFHLLWSSLITKYFRVCNHYNDKHIDLFLNVQQFLLSYQNLLMWYICTPLHWNKTNFILTMLYKYCSTNIWFTRCSAEKQLTWHKRHECLQKLLKLLQLSGKMCKALSSKTIASSPINKIIFAICCKLMTHLNLMKKRWNLDT